MKSLEELFSFIFNNNKTVVYGNLGRQNHILFEYLVKNYPTFEIHVFSKYYTFPTTNNIVFNPDSIGKCDLLIYLEPVPGTTVISPVEVSHTVVFTSHLLLKELMNPSVYVSYFHVPSILEEITNTQAILSLQDSSVQAVRGDTLKQQIGYFETKTIGVNYSGCDFNLVPGKTHLPLLKKTFMIADVTNTESSFHLLLYLWDILDYLKANIQMVDRWVICFPENRLKKYTHFVQECLNKLFCRNFMHGNITSTADLLAMTPFYKSGVIDKKISCDIKTFCKLAYIAPASDTDAFAASINHNLKFLTRQIFLVNKVI